MLNSLENQFRYSLKNYGVSVLVDSTETTAFFKEIENSNGLDTKYLYTDAGIVKQGSIVEALGAKWLVISKETNFNSIYDKAVIRKAQFEINFIIDDALKVVPAIVDTKTIDTSTGQYITIAENNIIVTISDIYNVEINDRFIKMDSAWKVTGLDKTKNGLVSLYAEKDSFKDGDDIENEIPAGLPTEEPPALPQEITISGADMISWGSTQEYNVSPTGDYTFTVSDGGKSNYYTLTVVDSDTCTIKHEMKGYVSIILRVTDNATGVYAEKEIEIKNLF